MYKFVLLAVVLSAFVVSDAAAQSAKKGSSTKSAGSQSKSTAGSSSRERAVMKKMERDLVIQKKKMATAFTKAEFPTIKLNKDQKQVLMQLLDENYDQIVELDGNIGRSIPSEKVTMLRKAYKMAKKEGEMEAEAMQTSMQAIGMPEMQQKKVLEYGATKQSLMGNIRTELMKTFDDDQKKMVATEMGDKEMGGKEMTDKKMEETKMAEGEGSSKKS